MTPTFVVTRRIPQPAIDLLEAAGEVWVSAENRALDADELQEAVSGARVIVSLLHDRVDSDLMRAAGPGLLGIANVAVGYDNIDLDSASARGLVVTNTPGVLTDATADLAMGLILATTRRLGEGERLIRARRPWSWHMDFLLGIGLRDRILGVVGLGVIGAATARRARAFGMRIVYSGRRAADPDLENELQARRVELDELFSTADVVSLHCPLTPATHHLVDASRLATMRHTSYLVNTARGPIVDEAALVDALSHGCIAGAALDVFEREPYVEEALLMLENVVLVPHLGSATVETRTAMAVLAARNAIAIAEGLDPPTPVPLPPRP